MAKNYRTKEARRAKAIRARAKRHIKKYERIINRAETEIKLLNNKDPNLKKQVKENTEIVKQLTELIEQSKSQKGKKLGKENKQALKELNKLTPSLKGKSKKQKQKIAKQTLKKTQKRQVKKETSILNKAKYRRDRALNKAREEKDAGVKAMYKYEHDALNDMIERSKAKPGKRLTDEQREIRRDMQKHFYDLNDKNEIESRKLRFANIKHIPVGGYPPYLYSALMAATAKYWRGSPQKDWEKIAAQSYGYNSFSEFAQAVMNKPEFQMIIGEGFMTYEDAMELAVMMEYAHTQGNF